MDFSILVNAMNQYINIGSIMNILGNTVSVSVPTFISLYGGKKIIKGINTVIVHGSLTGGLRRHVVLDEPLYYGYNEFENKLSSGRDVYYE